MKNVKTKLLTLAVMFATSSVMAADSFDPNPAQADVIWNGTVPLTVNNDDIVLTGNGANPIIEEGTLNNVTNKGLFSSSVITVEAHENVDGTGKPGDFIPAGLVDWQITSPVFVSNGTAIPVDFSSNITISNDGVGLDDTAVSGFTDDNSKLNLTVQNTTALDDNITLLPGEAVAVQATVLAKLNAGLPGDEVTPPEQG